MKSKQEYSFEVGGKKITATFSDLTDQANGSVIVKMGESVVLATAVMANKERTDLSYFPLTVDYEEKFYAAGLVLGGRFLRREGRPSEEAILAGRAVDRTIRPLFDRSFRRDVQVILTILSIDDENDTDVLSILAASLALGTSDIPWNGPVSAVRIGVGTNEKGLIINPTYKERECSILDMLVCGKDGNINMIEAEGKEIPEGELANMLKEATQELKEIQEFQSGIIQKIGKSKLSYESYKTPEQVVKYVDETLGKSGISKLLFNSDSSGDAFSSIFEQLTQHNPDFFENYANDINKYVDELVDKIIHEEALNNEARVDGRALSDVRELYTEAGGISKNLHGSGTFYRGGTHVLSVLTLGGPKDSQLVEGMEVRMKKYFMHHYNFPPYSAGETGRIGGLNRRAIGHGALAERALAAIIPEREKFPYTIRLVSESMASNGSTSMASVCAGSLALADGGVPIKNHVAGIAMGLVTIKDTRGSLSYKILTDIQGPEDHHGDMDLKVAGTRTGVTAIQMDVKVEGIEPTVLAEALDRAKIARFQILDAMESTLPSARPSLQDSSPRIETVLVSPEKIGALIGPGGKTIRGLSEETGTEIEVEEDGTTYISGKKDAVLIAKRRVEELTRVYAVGDRFDGKVIKMFDFGVIVQIAPETEGLVHISELAPHRVEKVTDVVCTGETVPVVIKDVDDRGKLSLSISKADPDFTKKRGEKVCKDIPESRDARYNNRDGREKNYRGQKR